MKSSKYPLLMNPDHLSESYQVKLQEILLYDKRLATAYRLKEGLRAIFHLPAKEVRLALEKWRRRAWSSRIPVFCKTEMQKVAERSCRLLQLQNVGNCRRSITDGESENTTGTRTGIPVGSIS